MICTIIVINSAFPMEGYWRRSLGRVFNLMGLTLFVMTFFIAYFGFIAAEPPRVYQVVGDTYQFPVILISFIIALMVM